MELTNKDMARGWIAALIDGEGCIYSRNTGANSVRVITISSTDRELIDCAARCYDLFGIEYTRSERNGATERHKYIWNIDVRRAAAMQRVLEEIPIQHIAKLQKLKHSLSFARGLHCKCCGCLHDERTDGCTDCRKRHQMRGYASAARARAVAQSADSLPIPSNIASSTST